jgi:hypothetical protein
MMKTYELRMVSPFLNPSWFNSVRSRWTKAAVQPSGQVIVEGEALRFVDEPPPLPPGTEVEVRLGQQFYCVTVADIEAHELEQRKRQAAEHEARERRLRQWRLEAEAFNATVNVPVRWEVAIKDVLSGLLEGSTGNGRNKATVEHIRLLEALDEGRLKRPAGAFLCTEAKGNYSNQKASRAYGEGSTSYQPKVNCKACLRIAARWMTSNTPDEAHGAQQ